MLGAMALVLSGIAVSFNVLIVLYKYQHRGALDAGVDAVLLALVMWLFKGSTDLLIIGTIASAIISIYLLFKPIDPELFEDI